MLKELLENVGQTQPLVQAITNYVTANDVANIILAAGGSPIMADAVEEVGEVAAKSQALYLNLGTLNERTVEAMLLAGKAANQAGVPVILDPVGAGFTKFRTRVAQRLLKEVKFDIIRGNISEIKALAGIESQGHGVDVSKEDKSVTLTKITKTIKNIAHRQKTIIVVSGKTDIISDGQTTYIVNGGDALMSKVTGTGCQLTALIATYVGANPKYKLEASLAAVSAMKICGALGVKRMSKLDGNASLRNYIIDAVFNLTGDDLEKQANYEIQ